LTPFFSNQLVFVWQGEAKAGAAGQKRKTQDAKRRAAQVARVKVRHQKSAQTLDVCLQ